ncbi:hypothetical protein EW145_g6286 [Phellinidium pouzarii]|uniref:Rhodanese domain-containing protein n=1 Tax=Phellinidium pouzarii TaxID=167371 RepID=A0A4S4KX38_9AGAM|nr:hypothetical protein EW145_g6286 [Phellinidium pouzarii]
MSLARARIAAEKQPAAIDEDTHNHLEFLRARVASGIAIRAVNAAELVDGVRVGVAHILDRTDSPLLGHVVAKLSQTLHVQDFLFAVAPGPPHNKHWPLAIVASSPQLRDKATALARAKFLGRVTIRQPPIEQADIYQWTASIADIGRSDLDEALLWDIVRKTPHVVQPTVPPSGARSIAALLSAARTRFERLSPLEVMTELRDPDFPLPVVLVDIRSAAERERHGTIPDALVVERSMLEWRFDPGCDVHLPIADRYDLRIIVFDESGLASSLAAAVLHDLGLLNSTDIVGGFTAWKEAGLPTQ